MTVVNSTEKSISDLEYALLTVLQTKAEAVQMYETYIQDAKQAGSQPCVELLNRLQKADAEQVQELRRHLQEVMQKGRM